jgi:hypothetical protein
MKDGLFEESTCPVCCCLVQGDLMDEHIHWHQTLTNLPKYPRWAE